MWATVVEAMLQRDHEAVMCAIDLENCFNAVDRDMLVDECLKHPTLQELARHVVATYPPGMVPFTRIDSEWRKLRFDRGIAQGRPLSPALAAILLQPCIVAAYDEMCRHARTTASPKSSTKRGTR